MDIREVVAGSFEMSVFSEVDLPRVMIMGDSGIFVENYLALCEYKSDSIKLATKLGIMEFSGAGFEIKMMKQNNIYISGKLVGMKISGREKV